VARPQGKRAPPEQAETDLKALQARMAVHGNISRAAQEAGISRQRAYRLLGARSLKDLIAAASDKPRDGD
jgi:transcriptional regulator of acetoin/glycerol metabolism